MNRNDHHHDTGNDDAEGRQQQQPRHDSDSTATAVLPDYKDQARPFPRIKAQSVVKTPPTVPAASSSTTPQLPPQKISTIPSARAFDGDTTKNQQKTTLFTPMTSTNAGLPNPPPTTTPLTTTTATNNQVPATTDSDNSLPLAQAVPISRFVDTDSLSHEQNEEEDRDEIGDNGVLPATLSSHPTKQSQSGGSFDGTSGGDNSNTLLVLTLKIKITRTTLITIVIVSMLVVLVTTLGVVCGMGRCSSDRSTSTSVNNNETTNNTPTNSPVADMNIDDNTAITIESYLSSISLTNKSLGGSGNTDDDILQQADEMAIQWIVDENVNIIENTGVTTISNISDPIVQQRLQQLFAILTMYYSTNNNENNNVMNWNNNTNWLQSQIHECDWYGITCRDNDSITDINLRNLGKFDADKDNDNVFSRRLQVARSISSRMIDSITLPRNNIFGPIHPNIGLLTALTNLDFSNNILTGTIPTTIQYWTNIETIRLNSNDLIGTIPDELCTTTSGVNATIIVDQDKINCFCCEYVNDDTIATTNAPDTIERATNSPNVSPVPMESTSVPIVTSQVMTPTTSTSEPNTPVATTEYTTLQSYIATVTYSVGGGTTDIDAVSPTYDAEQTAIDTLEMSNDNFFMLNPNDVNDQFRIRQWYALLTLYFSTKGADWTENWGTFGIDECRLAGIICLNQTDAESGITYNAVDRIEFPDNALKGRLPIDLALLSDLTYMDLSDNALTGTIPNQFIESTPNMQNFIIDNNTITGTLASSLGTWWSNMQLFDVSNNMISGTLVYCVVLHRCMYPFSVIVFNVFVCLELWCIYLW